MCKYCIFSYLLQGNEIKSNIKFFDKVYILVGFSLLLLWLEDKRSFCVIKEVNSFIGMIMC